MNLRADLDELLPAKIAARAYRRHWHDWDGDASAAFSEEERLLRAGNEVRGGSELGIKAGGR
jgi:hypothetical protein